MKQIRQYSSPHFVQTKQWFQHPLFIAGWIGVCFLVGLSLIRSGLQARNAFVAKQQAEANLHEKEEKGLQLMEQLKEANTPYAQEKIIRDELNLQLPGEVILQLPSPSP